MHIHKIDRGGVNQIREVNMGKLTGLVKVLFPSLPEAGRRAEALRKRKIEKELRAQGYSVKRAKIIVSQLQDGK